MFWANKKYVEVTAKIGPEIHRQITEAMSARGKIFTSVEEVVYFTGYMQVFVRTGFNDIGVKNLKTHFKYTKHICEGVMPAKLWEYFCRGKAVAELAQKEKKDEYAHVIEAYEAGVVDGNHDARKFFNNETQAKRLATRLSAE